MLIQARAVLDQARIATDGIGSASELSKQLKLFVATHTAFSIFCTAALTATVLVWFLCRPRAVYLLDFYCHKPDDKWKVTKQQCLDVWQSSGHFTEQSMAFLKAVVDMAGVGDETYLPKGYHAQPLPALTFEEAKEEAESVVSDVVQNVLDLTGIKPRQIDVVIVVCSCYRSVPSLAAFVVHRFRMRSDTIIYNFSGQGCAGGMHAVGLAKEIMQAYTNINVLVVATENITLNWYKGNQRSMLIPSCLFRLGGTACVLTNRPAARFSAKYKLQHVVRKILAAQDTAYDCVKLMKDDEGFEGVKLSRDLVKVAGQAMTANLSTLGPMVLPVSEKAKYLWRHFERKVLHKDLKPYIPQFRRVFDHFCLHTGGRAVLDELETALSLSVEDMEPSRRTLRAYGNISSASVWYVLAAAEYSQRVRRGDKVLQIAFGSGFKCNSVVWQALRANGTQHPAWAPTNGKK